MAGRARRHEHVPRRQSGRRCVELQHLLLRVKHHAVLRLFVDLQLGVVRTEVALSAGRGQTGDGDRRGMPRVARGARADGSVLVRLADAVALSAAARGRGRSLELCQGVGRAPGAAWLIALRELDLFRLQPLLTEDRGPRSRRVAAPQELLVDRLVTASTVPRRQLCRDDETVMVFFCLTVSRLMTVEAVDALLRVPAQLVLVDDRVLLLAVALRALAGGPHEFRRGLIRFDARPRTIHQERADDQGKRHDDGDEHRPKRHEIP